MRVSPPVHPRHVYPQILDCNSRRCYRSCYTFSATGAIEGAYAIKYGHLMDLSMQQVRIYDTRASTSMTICAQAHVQSMCWCADRGLRRSGWWLPRR